MNGQRDETEAGNGTYATGDERVVLDVRIAALNAAARVTEGGYGGELTVISRAEAFEDWLLRDLTIGRPGGERR